MATGYDRRPIRKSRARADDIADSIDLHRQAELAHPADHQFAPLPVLVAQRQSTYSIAGDAADLGQLIETPAQTLTVDAQIFACF